MDKRKTQKKTAQKALNDKSRHSRFIAEYVLRKEPEVYKEANSFYDMLKGKHPNKRDLTKTHEFLVGTTSYVDYRDFYCRKKLKHRKESTITTTTTTTTTKTTRVDNMELNIDLLTPQTVAENTVPLQVIPDDLYEQLVTEISVDPDLQHVLNNMIAPQANDLPEDPGLNAILDDLQQTPLEKELGHMGTK